MYKETLETCKEFVRPYYSKKDPAHNFEHIERIIRNTAVILKEISEPICLPRLFFLASFHGLAPLVREDEDFREKVKVLLGNLGWNKEEIEEVFASLFRHLKSPQTVEEKIVHDANYLEMLGALGIAKAFTMGGANEQSFEETADIFEYRYLDKVEFQTPAGQRLAREKKEYTKDFLRRLRTEW